MSLHDPSLVHPSTEAAFINAVVNHPEVRPFLGLPDAGELDFSPLMDGPDWFLMGDHGGFALTYSGPGIREVHTFVLPSGRGRWAMKAAQDGIRYAKDHGTRMLWTKVPRGALHVEAFTRKNGMLPSGETIVQFGTEYDIFHMELGPCQQQ